MGKEFITKNYNNLKNECNELLRVCFEKLNSNSKLKSMGKKFFLQFKNFLTPLNFEWRREWLPSPVFLSGKSHG